MANKKSYAQLTRELTGLSKAEYKKQYTEFSKRVRNYNRITGENYSAAQQFYYSKRYAGEESPSLRAIMETPATQARAAGVRLAVSRESVAAVLARQKDVVLQRWAGYIKKSKDDYIAGFGAGEAWDVAAALEADLITPQEANEQFKEIAHQRDIRRDQGDPAYSY